MILVRITDSHKIVIMDHVEIDHLMTFITDLKATIQKKLRLMKYNSTQIRILNRNVANYYAIK